jgi:endonuclease-3
LIKRPFDIDLVIARVRHAVEPFPKAAMFELAEDGFRSVFQQLVACIISVRTYDEVSLPAARRLLSRARTAVKMLRLTPQEIDALIRPATFHENKAEQIHAIARRVVAELGGELPCDPQVLLSFTGVGPKCAHLTLGIAGGEPFISTARRPRCSSCPLLEMCEQVGVKDAL